MHLDPIAARRTQAGAPVVHGIHALLWTLDVLATCGRLRQCTTYIEAEFQKFIFVDSLVSICLVGETEDAIEIQLESDGLATTTITIRRESAGVDPLPPPDLEEPSYPTQPVEHALQDLVGLHGRFSNDSEGSIRELALQFPHAAAVLGEERVQGIALTSKLVGMICPGLHSIYNSLVVQSAKSNSSDRQLNFRVSDVDERFRRVELSIWGSGLVGDISAFVRLPPVLPPDFSQIADVVSRTEFSEISALVVGGSRGLGAVAAKIIAAGGGRSVVTYAVGRLDAELLRDEIISERGPEACRIIQYDVRRALDGQLTELGCDFNQLYYFATPQIFGQTADLFATDRLAEFLRFYVDAFYELCIGLRQNRADELRVFYPSSVGIDQRPKGITEYCMAKVAGEILCDDMNKFMRGIRVISSRLPRMLTDQSATVVPTATADAIAVLLPLIRQMNAPAAT